MDMILTRHEYSVDGIFSILTDSMGIALAETLEHAYTATGDSTPFPKIPNGTYTCVRGAHHLGPQATPIETFEVTGVAGHTRILFHPGNYNRDSEGCILLGSIPRAPSLSQIMIYNSKESFTKFMELQKGVNTFKLIVQDTK